VQRAFAVSGILGGCTLLGLAWITALRRRVRQQTEQLREQLERQARLEREVQRAARLESLGTLAGGIAHDFNNLLTIIIGNLGLATLDEDLTESTAHALREIERGADRARALTQQLLTFAKGGGPLRATIELPELVKRAADLALHGSNVRCEFSAAADLWTASVDKEQIIQAIQNLVLNAVQAMPRGGILRIALNNDVIESGAKGSLEAGRYVKLAIADSGDGISEDVIPHIFDPYFSTRKTSSGLGLATVYSIVTKHRGQIEVASAPGRGTTFSVWLPAAELPKEEAPPAEAQASVLVLSKTSRILLMDDEESIREIGAAILRRMGLEPVVISDGAEAVREFKTAQQNGLPFALVILDLTIPGGMGGKEAMGLIRKLDPDVPAIVSSGYSIDPVLENFAAYGFQAMVPKPYEVSELARVVNRLLGRIT
jgi:signal transduction histidine kinase/CheY-like chemotaxis protein